MWLKCRDTKCRGEQNQPSRRTVILPDSTLRGIITEYAPWCFRSCGAPRNADPNLAIGCQIQYRCYECLIECNVYRPHTKSEGCRKVRTNGTERRRSTLCKQHACTSITFDRHIAQLFAPQKDRTTREAVSLSVADAFVNRLDKAALHDSWFGLGLRHLVSRT